MTIKEFSNLCGCNAQTLRYYDSINLLKPARVDQFTGYRYYDSNQALDYVKIKNLQDAMFTIDEIKKLLEADDEEIVQAFESKIREQEAKLERIKMIQMSYRRDYMSMLELIKDVQKKLNENVGSYDAGKEYGISEDYYRSIIEKMNEQYEKSIEQLKDASIPMDGNHSFERIDIEVESPLKDCNNILVLQKDGWNHTVEVLGKLPKLDGEFILYFELDEEKYEYSDFCMVVLSIVQDRNKESGYKITCSRNLSQDGKNHFWLLKR